MTQNIQRKIDFIEKEKCERTEMEVKMIKKISPLYFKRIKKY